MPRSVSTDGVTVRLEPRALPVASFDDGRPLRLGKVAGFFVRVGVALGHPGMRTDPGTSAVALGTIAEAQNASPAPRDRPIQNFVHEGSEAFAMCIDLTTRSHSLLEIFAQRESASIFARLTRPELDEMLASIVGIHSMDLMSDGSMWSHRVSPSAGGRHPIDLIVLSNDVDGLPPGFWVVDPARLSYSPIERIDRLQIETALRDCGQFEHLPPAVVLLRADFNRTLSRYPAGAVHVWRDAGCLLMTLHLRATDLSLASRILGFGGRFGETSRRDIAYVGALALGGRSTTTYESQEDGR